MSFADHWHNFEAFEGRVHLFKSC